MSVARTVAAQLWVESLIPSPVLQEIGDRSVFLGQIARYVAMDDDELYRVTEVYLRNLGRLDREVERDLGPDAQLRHVLVPELWERLRPESRDVLRRISTSLAEYDPDSTRRSSRGQSSLWRRSRFWSTEREASLRAEAVRLREDVARAAAVDDRMLVERVQLAAAGSRSARAWAPDCPVYEAGFVYRLAPVVAWRVLLRGRPSRA